MVKKYSLDYFQETSEKKVFDEASTTVVYLGFAERGTALSAPKWVIVRITTTNGSSPVGEGIIEWATQIGDNSNIWDNRASLIYVS